MIDTNMVIHVGPIMGPLTMPRGEVFRVDHPLDWPDGPDWPKHWTAAPGTPVDWIRTWYLQYHAEYLFATPYISHDPDTIHRQVWGSGFFWMSPLPVPEERTSVLLLACGLGVCWVRRQR